MSSIQVKNAQNVMNARDMTRAYDEKIRERKEVEEKAYSYKEELKKAREEEQETNVKKKAMIKKEPVDGQGSTVARKSAQQMLDLLTELAGKPNMPANIIGNTSE